MEHSYGRCQQAHIIDLSFVLHWRTDQDDGFFEGGLILGGWSLAVTNCKIFHN